MFKTLSGDGNSEVVVKKSKFIGFSKNVITEEECKEFIKGLRKTYYDARHVCYAYVLKDGTVKSNDDGEPAGTGGMPILETIKKNKLTDTIVVVVRYFGGTLLGTSLLYRSYASCAELVIKNSKICKMIKSLIYSFEITYENYAKFENFAKNNNIRILYKEFGKNAKIQIGIPKEKIKDVLDGFKLKFNIELDTLEFSEIYLKYDED